MNTINLIAKIDTIVQLSKRQKTYRERVDPFVISDDQFKERYRFNKSTVRKIINIVKPEIELDKRGCGTSAKLQVLVALRCWGQREIQNDAAALHGLTQPTVSRSCARVARALARLSKDEIKMPESITEEKILMKDFESIKNFPGVIGAIHDTNMKIQRMTGGDLDQNCGNREGCYSLHVQIICDARLVIRDVLASLRSNSNNFRIFNESTIMQRFEKGEFQGRLLGSSSYELHPYLFTPLSMPQNEKEFQYNIAHIATRSPAECCFKNLKQRFRCLIDVLRINVINAKMLIVALAVLHNIAIQENDLVPDGDSNDEEKQNEEEENEIIDNGNTYTFEGSDTTALNDFIQEHF